jgi:cephalosporin hydroxylase
MNAMPAPVSWNVHLPMQTYWDRRAAQHTTDTYAGVPISKFPEDLRVYEHLLWEAAPDTVIEIGTHFGGSTLWLRDRLRTIAAYRERPPGQVISLDRDQSLARVHLARADPGYADGIHLIEGDVRDRLITAEVRALVKPNCLVIEDSAHEYATTLAALEGFADLVAVGGYFVVEDGCVDVEELRIDPSWPRGVLPALTDWLVTPAGQRFVVRDDLQIYGLTSHPGGFLQRVS